MWVLIFLLILLLIFIVVIYTDSYRYISLEYHDIYQLDHEYQYKKKIKNTVISLTTTPNRLHQIKHTLLSLLDSSVAVDEIRLNIPYYSCKGVKYRIPNWLKKLKSVKIYRTIKDWGPATKLLPTLSHTRNRKTKIIVVDDDVIYGYYMAETLNDYFEKYDRKVAMTIYGDEIDKHNRMKYDLTTRAGNYITGEKYTDVLRGHSAYMVTPNMFTEDIYEYEKVPKECFFVDDNYFSFHLKKNKVKIMMIGMSYKAVPLPDMVNCFTDGLHRNENTNGKNEVVVNKYFNKY